MRSVEPPHSRPHGKPTQVRFTSPIPLVGAGEPRHDKLIRRLALDRLRDLHDDGVTVDYIGRMYGVSGDKIRAVEADLRG